MQLVRNRIPGLVLSTWFTYLVSQNKGVSIWEDDPVNWNELPDIIALESIGEWVGQKSVETSQARAAAFNDGAAESKFIDDVRGRRNHHGRPHESLTVAHPATDCAITPTWNSLPKGQVLEYEGKSTQKHDVEKKINIGINRGAWADVTNKHINLHLIINVDEKSATLRTYSPTHSVFYTLQEEKSGLVAWRRYLGAQCQETINFYSEEGEVYFYVDAGDRLMDQ
ncbi:hypothetical protein Pst134EA_001075 [Puccinia striiformis f. sp. tritici]|uniref:hypothetical protein n=1 Tax=Puccinia striiformis f. sp. tritici TaxID=168172 RepID=UPI0020076F42|nr:hypothetical protein Pst134EA_001075 [Puccinia striiformis f. sp. tritici]KAH9474022.1 hypothetical protein Pst134EA_001075 [Puccinia striiformis f. sp. tritici]